MLALTPKFHEEIVFQSEGVQIRLKFYLDQNEQLRVAITAPRCVAVSREKIKGPVNEKAIGRHRTEKMSQV